MSKTAKDDKSEIKKKEVIIGSNTSYQELMKKHLTLPTHKGAIRAFKEEKSKVEWIGKKKIDTKF